ncbi:MAG: glycoside hydrolase family 88 protein, partial [Bacteroidales bacterium]|nr:glycoside hydrolase family 88 protein [Bacteroidales bacterium]
MLLVFQAAAHAASPLEELYKAAITRDVPPGRYEYNWRDAVLLKALTDLYRTMPDKQVEIAAYIAAEMERVAPKAHGAHPNGIASAVGFAFLKETGRATPATDKALARVLAQYERIPRTADGACSHRTDRVELWDDTLYMLNIAFIACYKATGDRKYLEWSAREILLHAKYLLDER